MRLIVKQFMNRTAMVGSGHIQQHCHCYCGVKAMSYGQSKPRTATWLCSTLPHTAFTATVQEHPSLSTACSSLKVKT